MSASPIKNYELRIISEPSAKRGRRRSLGGRRRIVGGRRRIVGGPGETSHGLGRIYGGSSETSHGLGHFQNPPTNISITPPPNISRTPVPPCPRVQHSSHLHASMPPNLRARACPRAPEKLQCGFSVGNKCDWNPEIGTENQGVMWQVWDVWVIVGAGGINKV